MDKIVIGFAVKILIKTKVGVQMSSLSGRFKFKNIRKVKSKKRVPVPRSWRSSDEGLKSISRQIQSCVPRFKPKLDMLIKFSREALMTYRRVEKIAHLLNINIEEFEWHPYLELIAQIVEIFINYFN